MSSETESNDELLLDLKEFPAPDKKQSYLSNKENSMFFADHDERLHRDHPNSVMIPCGRSFISWHSENGVAVLALIIFIVLCILALLTEIIAMFPPDKAWASDFLKLLGQGIIGTAGAIIGSGTTAIISKNEKKSK
ncbi:MAG: hypothetical protein ACRCVY_06590 [Commensalibacter sp.]